MISVSRDGSVLLWECSSGECVAELADGKSEVNSCHLISVPSTADGICSDAGVGDDEAEASGGSLVYYAITLTS